MNTNKTIKGLAVALSLSAVIMAGVPSASAWVSWNGGNYTWPDGGVVYELGSGDAPALGANGLEVRNSTGGTMSMLDDVVNIGWIRLQESARNLNFTGTGALVFGGDTYQPGAANSGIFLKTSILAANQVFSFNTDIYVGGNFNATTNSGLVIFGNIDAPQFNNTLVFGATDARKTIAGLQTNTSGTAELRLFGVGGGMIHDYLADGVNQASGEQTPLTGTTTLGLTMLSSATWTLTGSGAYTGETKVMGGGRLVLDNSSLNAEKISDRLVLGGTTWGPNSDGVPIWFGGGGATVELIGSDTADSAETLSTLTLLNGGNRLIATANGHATIFNLGTITRGSVSTGGATLDLQVDGAGAAFKTANTDGDLGAWVTLNGSDYASASGGDVVAATYAGWGAGNNVSISADEAQSGGTASKLKIDGGATLTLDGDNTLTDGGILFAKNSGSGNATIIGGTLTADNGEFIIQQHNTDGALEIASALSAATLTKSGAGDFILSGASSASTVNINAGSLKLGADNALAGAATSAGVVNVDVGATLDLNGHSLTVWSLQSRNAYYGQVSLEYGRSAVVGNFTAGTEATLIINRADTPATMVDAFYGDFATGDGAVMNIVKTGGGYARMLWGSNSDGNHTGGYVGNTMAYIYDLIAGNVRVEQGTLALGNSLYVYGGLEVAAGAVFRVDGSGQYGFGLPAFTGLTGAGNIQSRAQGQGVLIHLDGSADADVWSGQMDSNTSLIFNGQGAQFVGQQTMNSANGIFAAGKAVVITPGLTQATGVTGRLAPLNVAGQGVIKVTGTDGVVAGAGGNGPAGISFGGGTIWIAPDGSGQNVTVSGQTAAANSTIAYGRAASVNTTGNLTALGGNSTLLLDRGANTSLDFQYGNAASTAAAFTRTLNGTLVLKAAHGLAEFGGAEKFTVFGDSAALPPLTYGIMNTSIVTSDTNGVGSFLTTSTVGVTNGVLFKEASYTTDLVNATGTSVVKHSGDIALADHTAVYALRNDGIIANDYTLTVGTGDAGLQTGLIMNNAAITGTGVISLGLSELTVYASGSNRIENKFSYAGGNPGAGIVGLTLFGDGLLHITAPQVFWAMVYLNSGVLELDSVATANWDSHSSFWLKGGVLQTSGIFDRTLSGGNSGSFMWYDGGFAAATASNLTVNVKDSAGNSPTLTWGMYGFMSDYSVLKLGSAYAQGAVTLVNNIDLGLSNAGGWWGQDLNSVNGLEDATAGALFRMIEVTDNPDTGADYAIISGVISSTMGDYKGIQKSGDGLLLLKGENTYTGPTSIAEGMLGIVADSGLGAAPSAAAPITGHVNQGTVLINGGATLLAFGDVTLSANRNILLASGSDGSRGARIATAENGILTFGGKLGDSVGEQGSLLVNGALRLTGNSTISGFTEVEEGTLLVDGGLTTAHVVIDTGAKLGGSGLLTTSTGGISVSGILDATDALTLDLADGQKLNFAANSVLLVDADSALSFASEG
ncbi:MAG: hypothetical protein LBK71_08360, partial [Verrucomicrobiales bacterium]|nr:hypothetical protein [Verrucomicrobiales bacterium]